VTDDTEFGTLPRFSRDIAVLSTRTSTRDGRRRDYGVLPPFSGALETRVERGRAPTLDLSYLTLEPLVAPGLIRSAGRGTETETVTPSDLGRESTATDAETGGVRGPTTTDTGTDEEREPTVREVIYGDSGDRTDEHTPDTGRLSSDVEPPSLRRLSAGSERPEGWTDTLRGRTGGQSGDPNPVRDALGDAPSDRSSEIRGRQHDTPPRVTVDRSGSADPPARREGSDASAGEESSPVDRLSGDDTPTRTVGDRSGASPEPTDGRADTGPESVGDVAAKSGDVPPPRMIAEDATADTARRSAGRSAAGGNTSRTSGQSDSRAAGPTSVPRTAAASQADRGGGDGPRLVVDRSDATTGSGADSTSDAGVGDTGESSAGDGEDLSDRTVDRTGTGATIREASRDPESPLIDRLYRTLKERERIENHRRGGR
jgi:hypothetical protein